MSGKEKVDIIRSDQFQEVDEELSRAMAELDFTIERVSAIFEGAVDENNPDKLPAPAHVEGPGEDVADEEDRAPEVASDSDDTAEARPR